MPIVGLRAADEHVRVSPGQDVAVGQKDLRDYARILWRRKWYIVLAVVICIGGVVGELRLHQPQYQATAEVLTQAPTSGTVDPTVIATESASSRATPYATMVAKHISDPGTISASQVQPGAIIQISATSPSPTMAARQANAWAAAYVTYRRSLAQNQALGSTAVIQQQIESLQKQIAALNYQIALEGPLSSCSCHQRCPSERAARSASLAPESAPTSPTSGCVRHTRAGRGDARNGAHSSRWHQRRASRTHRARVRAAARSAAGLSLRVPRRLHRYPRGSRVRTAGAGGRHRGDTRAHGTAQ